MVLLQSSLTTTGPCVLWAGRCAQLQVGCQDPGLLLRAGPGLPGSQERMERAEATDPGWSAAPTLAAGCPRVSHFALESLSLPFWESQEGSSYRIFVGLQIMCAQHAVDIKLSEKGSGYPTDSIVQSFPLSEQRVGPLAASANHNHYSTVHGLSAYSVPLSSTQGGYC